MLLLLLLPLLFFICNCHCCSSVQLNILALHHYWRISESSVRSWSVCQTSVRFKCHHYYYTDCVYCGKCNASIWCLSVLSWVDHAAPAQQHYKWHIGSACGLHLSQVSRAISIHIQYTDPDGMYSAAKCRHVLLLRWTFKSSELNFSYNTVGTFTVSIVYSSGYCCFCGTAQKLFHNNCVVDISFI